MKWEDMVTGRWYRRSAKRVCKFTGVVDHPGWITAEGKGWTIRNGSLTVLCEELGRPNPPHRLSPEDLAEWKPFAGDWVRLTHHADSKPFTWSPFANFLTSQLEPCLPPN